MVAAGGRCLAASSPHSDQAGYGVRSSAGCASSPHSDLTVPRIDRKRPPVPACKQACLHAGVTVLVQYRYRTGIPTVYRVYSRTAVLLAVTGGRSLGTVRQHAGGGSAWWWCAPSLLPSQKPGPAAHLPRPTPAPASEPQLAARAAAEVPAGPSRGRVSDTPLREAPSRLWALDLANAAAARAR
jgi:hypothetical protein